MSGCIIIQYIAYVLFPVTVHRHWHTQHRGAVIRGGSWMACEQTARNETYSSFGLGWNRSILFFWHVIPRSSIGTAALLIFGLFFLYCLTTRMFNVEEEKTQMDGALVTCFSCADNELINWFVGVKKNVLSLSVTLLILRDSRNNYWLTKTFPQRIPWADKAGWFLSCSMISSQFGLLNKNILHYYMGNCWLYWPVKMPDFCASCGCSNCCCLETKTSGITFHLWDMLLSGCVYNTGPVTHEQWGYDILVLQDCCWYNILDITQSLNVSFRQLLKLF